MPSQRPLRIFAACLLAINTAHAAVFETVWEVTPVDRTHIVITNSQYISESVPGDDLKPFLVTTRFEPLAESMRFPQFGDTSVGFAVDLDGGWSFSTPYTAELSQYVLTRLGANASDDSSASFGQGRDQPNLDTSRELKVRQGIAFTTTVSGSVSASPDAPPQHLQYLRQFRLSTLADPVLPTNLSSQDLDAALLTWLQARVGTTFDNGFTESRIHSTTKHAPADWHSGLWMQDTTDSIWINGNVTLRAVSVVPEPGTLLLLSLGLAALGIAVPRRPVAAT